MPVVLPLSAVDWRVLLVDSAGSPLSVGGGTQYVDGVTQATPTGNVVEWLDAANVIRAASATKPLPVNVISGGGGSQVDASAWTTAVTSFAPGGGVFNDSAAALTSGQQGTQRLTAQRAAHANLRTTAGVDVLLTNNGAAPAALTNLGTLGALANAAAPSWTEGRQVLHSVDLAGNLRTLDATLPGRFPVAAATADTLVNPTVTQIETLPMVWNGTTWDRAKDMAAAQALTTFTGVPAMAPFYLDTTGTPSIRRGVTGASTTAGVTGTQIPGTANQVWDATSFRPQLGDTSGRTVVVGAAASGAAVAGNPVLHGWAAVAHGANPTAVAAGQAVSALANRAGVGFVIGGHPNVQTIATNFTGAQTDTALVTIATGLKLVVTSVMIKCHAANTVNVSARVGFGTVNTPAYGNTGLLLTDPGIAPGSGVGRGGGSGILGVGTDDQDLRVTLSVPTSGSVDVIASYYTIES